MTVTGYTERARCCRHAAVSEALCKVLPLRALRRAPEKLHGVYRGKIGGGECLLVYACTLMTALMYISWQACFSFSRFLVYWGDGGGGSGGGRVLSFD